MKFVHTADWQLGKPFARASGEKRPLLQQERFEVIKRIGEVARENGAAFIVVAGDVFDSSSASKATVAAACSAIGYLKMPVVMIPGNHDHGGPGSIWEQEFFQRERESLAPNLRLLLAAEPLELDDAVILPCPLLRRAETTDTTSWLRSADIWSDVSISKPRIVLAHGSTQAFTSRAHDDEEAGGDATNQLDLSRLPEREYDYIALGDWHGTKKVGASAWYSGTPELDRFPKGEENDPGNILVVDVERGQAPTVTPVRTARFRWSELSFDFADDSGFDTFEARLMEAVGQRANEDLLQLRLTGAVGIAVSDRLEKLIEALQARLLRIKLTNETTIAPTESEVESLMQRPADPLISRVAQQLVERSRLAGGEAAVAAVALRELHAAVISGRGG